GLDAVAVFEEQDSEAVKAGVLQGEAVLSFVHAEAAGAAGASREEDVVVEDLLAGEPFLLEELQILKQIADRGIGRIALAVVAKFFARLEPGDVGDGELLAAIAAALEDGADQVFVLPGEAAEQDGDVLALLCREGTFDRAMKVGGLVETSDLPQA